MGYDHDHGRGGGGGIRNLEHLYGLSPSYHTVDGSEIPKNHFDVLGRKLGSMVRING